MGRVDKTVFISYRRTNLPWALAIYQDLTHHGYDVFFDYESINSGDFEQIILGNIKARANFVVVLTPSALERCENPDDWLRREIEAALDYKRNVVPLMLEGFNFGSPSIAKYLTGKLELLKKYNGLNVPADYFEEAMIRLRDKYLNVTLDAVLHPLSTTAAKAVKRQQVAASKATQVKRKELSAQQWFEEGYKHGEAGRYDNAIRCYTEAIRLQPDYYDAYHNRGLARVNMGDVDGAIQDYDETIRLKPDYASAYNKRGVEREAKGDIDGAISDYTLAIKYVYTGYEHLPYHNRGLARYNKGDLDGAIEDYNEAIRLKPDDASSYNKRGVAREAKGDLDGAISDYNLAIMYRYAEEEYLPYFNRGLARKIKGDLNGAIQDYTEAIRLRPDYAEAYYNRALAHDSQSDFDAAIEDYNETIRLKPDYVNAYWGRGSAWFNKGDYKSAVADYQKYFDLGGTDKEVRKYLNQAKKTIGESAKQ